MGKKLEKIITKIMPLDRFLIAVAAFTFNNIVYGGSRMIAGDWEHHILTSTLDERIPFIPATLVIYFGCYLFWAVNYVIIAKLERERAYRFYFADFLSRIVCLAFFLLYPTTNIRPEVTGTGIWNEGMRFLYAVDAADNLFPSIHCLVSWFCYIGIRGSRKVPGWYQKFSLVYAVLVFISTLTTKQHVIIDVIGGVVIAELCLLFAGRTEYYRGYMRMWEKIAARLSGAKGEHDETCEEKCF